MSIGQMFRFRYVRSLIPLIFCGLAAIVILFSIVVFDKPISAGDWGSILSATASIAALGALLTTLALQRDELALQRNEISRLAVHAQEQSLNTHRQTLIESYRGIDEKINALFNDSDFSYLLTRCADPNGIKYIIDDIYTGDFGISCINFRGLHNCSNYEFVTIDHCFPISYELKKGDGEQREFREAILPIRKFCILSGILDASVIAKHIYDLSSSLGLLDYARSVMNRRTLLEPMLYLTSSYTYVEISGAAQNILIAPQADRQRVEILAKVHIEKRAKFYNLVAAALAGLKIDVDLLSPEAEEPLSLEKLTNCMEFTWSERDAYAQST